MKHVFLDTNVVIDFLANRQPFSLQAAKLFDAAEGGDLKIYVSAISYSNIYYIMRQSLPHQKTVDLLEELTELTEVADVTSKVIAQSFKTEFKDYEDSIQYCSAINLPEVDAIVTRNTKDFKKSTLPVFTPEEAVALLQL